MDTFRIETPRLILREFVPEDLAGLYRLYEESDTRYIEPLAKDPEEELEKLKNMDILDDGVTMASSLQEQNLADMDALADAVAASVLK